MLKLDASNVPDHTPVSFTIIIECHGDYLGSVMRVEDGKVVEGRDYYDSATIARQLGVLNV